MSHNHSKSPKELQNFFLLQEVYGVYAPITFADPAITPLALQRMRVAGSWLELAKCIREEMAKLEEQSEEPEKKLGYIYKDLQTLETTLTKVTCYFASKIDRTADTNDPRIGALSNKVVPLFESFDEPSEDQVGYLIDLKCGHTQRPSDWETVSFTLHLEAAGFTKRRLKVAQPKESVSERSANSVVDCTPRSEQSSRKQHQKKKQYGSA